MLNTIRQWLIRVLTAPAPDATPNTHAVEDVPYRSMTSIVAYDENLLERSRTQWQFGDWASLALLERDTIQHHPDRAKIALLVAAGHSATGNFKEARQYTRVALEWGCSKKLVSQILIAGVHNTLGCVAAVIGQEQCALQHFRASLQVGAPQSDVHLLAEARASQQFSQLGLSAPPPPIAGVREPSNPFDANLGLTQKASKFPHCENFELVPSCKSEPRSWTSKLLPQVT